MSHSIPIIINNFNRLRFLKEQVNCFKKLGLGPIVVLDNNSTYEPLLEYYKQADFEVIFQGRNAGCYGLWESSAWERFRHDHYIYTDPDILPSEDCPEDFLDIFLNLLDRFPQFDKVGFGLKIDDLPDHFELKSQVIERESKLRKKKFGRISRWQAGDLFCAPIDTTFALYRPGRAGGWWLPALRTAGNLLARHMPWYENPSALSEEEVFYRKSCCPIALKKARGSARMDWSKF